MTAALPLDVPERVYGDDAPFFQQALDAVLHGSGTEKVVSRQVDRYAQNEVAEQDQSEGHYRCTYESLLCHRSLSVASA
jgi:hypothetical protein